MKSGFNVHELALAAFAVEEWIYYRIHNSRKLNGQEKVAALTLLTMLKNEMKDKDIYYKADEEDIVLLNDCIKSIENALSGKVRKYRKVN